MHDNFYLVNPLLHFVSFILPKLPKMMRWYWYRVQLQAHQHGQLLPSDSLWRDGKPLARRPLEADSTAIAADNVHPVPCVFLV